MIPQRWIEAYLRFLLHYRGTVMVLVAGITIFFAFQWTHVRLNTNFLDFYPKYRTATEVWRDCRGQGGGAASCLGNAVFKPGPNPYIQFYNEFRKMFGTVNVMSVILEVKKGDIYNPATLQKLDRITKYMVNTKGVVPYQITSIAHPALNSITVTQGGVQVRPIFYPGIPQTQEDADRVRFSVYANPNIRGLYVANDDTAAVVNVGFWEEKLDFEDLSDRMMALKHTEEDANHTIYITGFPWLYTSVLQYAKQLILVFGLTVMTLAFLLYAYFRTWTGIWVPIFSGVLSSIWGVGMASLLGFDLDPLVLVIPIFLTARALSHSVQSMDRYHEEYYRLKDRHQAIIVSYQHLFEPAMSGIIADGMGLLVVAIAPIPLIQKVAIFASFWIVSIFISVVTLHPVILSYIQPPPEHVPQAAKKPFINIWFARAIVGSAVGGAIALHLSGSLPAITIPYLGVLSSSMIAFLLTAPFLAWYWWTYCEQAYVSWTRWVVNATEGSRRWVVIAITVAMFFIFPIWGWTLKVGDLTPGSALLFPDHPYNIGWGKLNEKFLGASQLIVIADTMKPDGVKGAGALTAMDEMADHMALAQGASGSITIVEVVKQLERLQHEGDPKWGLIPVNPKELAQIIYTFTQNAGVGSLNFFMDPSARYGSIITLFRGYSHDTIMNSLAWAKQFAEEYKGSDVQFRFAGGLFGILAAVNDAVENSYWMNLGLVFFMVYFCLYMTYGSFYCAAILLVPVILSQLAAEAFMVIMHIDLNVNSLPIAAAGAGVGVDYGMYHFSRMVDAFDEVGVLDEAVDYATATTGKAIVFTGTTMMAGTAFFWLSDLKFLAEMGLLLSLLMMFNKFGALIVVPAFVKVLRPSFLVNRTPKKKAVVIEQRAAVAG
jgi:predicted RND superfamily exporter protein